MKKIVLIAGVVLLLGGGGAGAFIMMGGDPPPAEDVAAEPVASGSHSSGGSHGAAPTERSGDPIYLRMDDITAPVMRGNKIRHYIFLNISLEMSSNSARDDGTVLKPRLQDAFLRELYSRPNSTGDASGTIDFEGMKKRLLKQARAVLGQDKVIDVLITRAMRGAG